MKLSTYLPLIDIPAPAAPPGSEGVLLVLSWIFWIVAIAGIIGILVLAISLFFMHRAGNGAPEFASKIAAVFGGLVLVGAAGAIVSTFIQI